MNVWIQYAVCAAVILFAGSRVSHYAEAMAAKSGLSKGWVGLIFLGAIASLSQLVASLSSVMWHDLPNMAVSALTGSCMFNMMMIGMLDFTSKDRPVSRMVQQGHILSVGFGIILMSLVAIDIMFGKHLPVLTLVHRMDPITLFMIPCYLIAVRLIFRFEKSLVSENGIAQPESKRDSDKQDNSSDASQSWPKLIGIFMFFGACIIAASAHLPAMAEEISRTTGWGEGFIGSTLIAITTCLPEVAVSVSAAMRGSFDMAVASLLGSNLCYIVILAVTDFCWAKDPLLRHVSQSNALMAMSAVVSMGIVVIALTYRAKKKFLFLAGDSIALILCYVLANVLLFTS